MHTIDQMNTLQKREVDSAIVDSNKKCIEEKLVSIKIESILKKVNYNNKLFFIKYFKEDILEVSMNKDKHSVSVSFK